MHDSWGKGLGRWPFQCTAEPDSSWVFMQSPALSFKCPSRVRISRLLFLLMGLGTSPLVLLSSRMVRAVLDCCPGGVYDDCRPWGCSFWGYCHLVAVLIRCCSVVLIERVVSVSCSQCEFFSAPPGSQTKVLSGQLGSCFLQSTI